MSGSLPEERVERRIIQVRGHKVMLDADLAPLYGVTVGRLNEAVRRNIDRFPSDFMFQLTKEEMESLRAQLATSHLKSQSAISRSGWGGRRTRPRAFTEQGVAMLSSVLRSKRAVQVNIEIMRAFVRLRRMVISHEEMARRVDALEKKYDAQLKTVFDAIRKLMKPPEPKRRAVEMLGDMVSPGHRVPFFAQRHRMLLKLRPIDLLETPEGVEGVYRVLEPAGTSAVG